MDRKAACGSTGEAQTVREGKLDHVKVACGWCVVQRHPGWPRTMFEEETLQWGGRALHK